jgi:hypothetical protein
MSTGSICQFVVCAPAVSLFTPKDDILTRLSLGKGSGESLFFARFVEIEKRA